ncbi:MAG: CHAT domain-containing protein [Bacteroidia bacterium]|nr:CHAT domain-containing protein [Bacteroidia bacterium]
MKRIILSLIILYFFISVKAQDYHKTCHERSRKVDSLKQLLLTLPPLDCTEADTTRMQLCLDIGDLYEYSVPDSAIWWYNSIADTLFSAEKTCGEHSRTIKQFPRRAALNATALRYLGIVYKDQGDYPKAAEYYEKSLKITEELGDRKGISNCLNNHGSVYYYQGDYPKAAEYYEKSMKIKEELGAVADMASYYPLLSDNFSILSEKETELYLDKTKSIFNHLHSFNINYCKLNDSIASVCYNNELVLKGLLLKSTRAILNVVYKSPDSEVKETYFYLKQLRNKISEMQGAEIKDREQKMAELEKQANEQERKLVRLSSEFADIQNLFNYKWQDVQRSLKPGEAAIEFVSFTQGKKNDTTVYAALLITPESKQPQTIRLFEDHELQKIIGTSGKNNYDYISNVYGGNSVKTHGVSTSLNNHRASLYDIIWQPLEQYLEGITTVYYAPVGVLNKISFAALADNTGSLLCDQYNLQQVSSTGKLLMPTRKVGITANITEPPETSDLAGRLQNLTAGIFGGIDYNPDTVKLELWKYLPGTLTEAEKIKSQLSDGKIPVALYTGKNATEESFKQLFGSNQTLSVPNNSGADRSCTDSLRLSQDNRTPSILHIATHGFFYPAPEEKQKNDTVQQEISETMLAFRGGTSGFGVWHFVRNKNPMLRSGLVFAGANRVWSEEWGRTNNEGVLTAQEVSQLNMQNTSLVVLSACETGLGAIKGSEGVYGLQRAFKMAGVKYIIMSLWQVPDKETEEFMVTFYTKLLKQKDVRKAFNETQAEMRKKYEPYYWMRKKYEPYYWAAFVLIE